MAINLRQFRVQAICDRGSALTWLRELVSTVDQKTVEMWRQAVIDNDPHEDDNTQVCDFVVTNIGQLIMFLMIFSGLVLLLACGVRADDFSDVFKKKKPFAITKTEPAASAIDEANNELRTFAVKLKARKGTGNAYGSGVIVSNGVLTCYHCIEGVQSIAVEAFDGETVPAMVAKYDAANDLALLAVKWSKNRKGADLSDSMPLPGAVLRSCARDRNGLIAIEEHSYKGIISNKTCVSNSFIGGMSGGGVFDQHNRLFGIVSETDMTTEPYHGRAVPIYAISAFLGKQVVDAQPQSERIPRVLYFHAPWCKPCQAQLHGQDSFVPYFVAAGFTVNDSDRAHIQLIDVEKTPSALAVYGVKMLPSVVLLDRVDGKVKAYEPFISKGRETIVDVLKGVK